MLSQTEKALCRSAVYRALSLGLSPPGSEVHKTLLAKEGRRKLSELLETLGFSGELDFRTGERAIRERYQQLFGHTAQGRVSPYETEYGGEAMFAQTRELADLGAFLAAFGLVIDSSKHERSDHLSSECEFMAFLSVKEAHAIESGDETMRDATRRAEALFLQDHLGRFAPAVGAQLVRLDEGDFYGELGKLLKRFVEAECAELQVPSGPNYLPLRTHEEDKVPMACEGCDLAGPEA